MSVMPHFYGGDSIGETYFHTCFACGAKFSTQSPRRLLGELGTRLMVLLVGLAILGFAVSNLVVLLSVLVARDDFFRMPSLFGSLLGLALGVAVTYFGARGAKDALAPVKAHHQNPIL